MSHKHRKSREPLPDTSEPRVGRSEAPNEEATSRELKNARIDGPHLQRVPDGSEQHANQVAADPIARAESLPIIGETAMSADTKDPCAAIAVTSPRGQMQIEAEQIAEYLEARAAELDRRETQLHAETARLESQLRMSRLSLRERHQALLEREAEIEGREAELARDRQEASAQLEENRRQLAHDQQRLGAEQITLSRKVYQAELRSESLAQQQSALAVAQVELELQRETLARDAQRQRQQIEAERIANAELSRNMHAGIERHRASLESEAERVREQAAAQPAIVAERLAELERLEKSLVERGHHFDERETQLQIAETEIAEARRRLDAYREAFFVIEREQKQTWAEHLRQDELRLQQRKAALDRLSETLDARRLALEQARDEVNRLHREALEMRLITEELWTRLSGAAPAATLTQSLAALRSQLADRFRWESAELAAGKRELLDIRDRLAAEHRQLAKRRHELHDWLRAQQTGLDERAAELARKDEALSNAAMEIEHANESWQEQKRVMQREIRRLQVQVRQHDLSAV